jgi:hypothetical protein
MPAKKPLSLIVRHDTKEQISKRADQEAAMTPIELLSAEVPPVLRGERYKYAAEVWKRCVNLYSELKGVIATPLDENLLIKYCKAEQQFIEMEKFRLEKINDWEAARTKAKKIKLTGNEKQIKEWRVMWKLVNDMEKGVALLDARLDAKGKYIHAMQQSLYLTPRSRAGVSPTKKAPEVIDAFSKNFD